jgi:hypothetical protein
MASTAIQRSTHVGVAALDPYSSDAPSPAAYGPPLDYWLPFRRVQEPLHSVQLDARDMIPQYLVAWSGQMRIATTDRRLYGSLRQEQRWGVWGAFYEKIVRQRYVNVPLYTVLGPPRATSGLNKAAFRRAQPQVKGLSLAQALQNAANTVARVRGAQGRGG